MNASLLPQPLILVTLLTSVLVSACSSSNSGRRGIEPDYSESSRAPGWAYAAEGFTFSKDQPIGQRNDYEFYYKRCEQLDRPYYSKTAYECSEAPR